MRHRLSQLAGIVLALAVGVYLPAEVRIQPFNRDRGWEGRKNRSTVPALAVVRQDFGYSRTQHAGGAAIVEMGATSPRWAKRHARRGLFAGRPLTTASPLLAELPARVGSSTCL